MDEALGGRRRLADQDRWPWLVRVLGHDQLVVGAGFLVDGRHVVTCAHVVNDALGFREDATEVPAEPVTVEFVDLLVEEQAARRQARVVPEGWVPISDRQRGDVAVLEVVGEPPTGAAPAPLRRPMRLRGHAFDATGFPAAAVSGLTASGEISRPAGPGGEWVQLDGVRVQGARVEQGFSGTPVWDQHVGAVVGMVVSELVGVDAKVSWMIPLEVISEYWAPLDQAIRVGLLYEPGERAAYWRPRARGVERDEAPGWYFTGRLRRFSE
jgi:hypothetical protein